MQAYDHGTRQGKIVEFTFGPEKVVVNVADRPALYSEITRRFRAGEGFSLATVNLDHLVKLQSDATFAKLYAAQDLIVADGRPIMWLSRLAKRPVAVIPGSDLVLPLAVLAAQEGMRIGLVGSTDAALKDAARALVDHAPGLEIAVSVAPPFGFDPDGEAAQAVLRELREAQVGLCFIALGAPKQERFASHGRALAPATGFASIGAGLDFLGGHQHRAPRWMQLTGLEWLWRIFGNPRRMIPRYAKCFAILPGQIRAAWKLRKAF